MKEEGILGLKRVLGLPEVVGIEVGQTIGAGVFAMTGIAIGICGAALPVAYALALIPVVVFYAADRVSRIRDPDRRG